MNPETEPARDRHPLPPSRHGGWLWTDLGGVLARLVVGGGFVVLGWSKVLDPVDFLKLIRQYEVVQMPVLLNGAAVVLPWLELCCGLFLITGIAVRGTALLSLAMLIPFTILVLGRALQIHAAGELPFCAIRFDCGCGAGEVVICHKLAENGILILLSALLAYSPQGRGCLRHTLIPTGMGAEGNPRP